MDPEFAAAGSIRPLDELEDEAGDFFPHVLAADRLDGRLFALPLFVDVGMLYYRRDLVEAPRSLDELRDQGLAMVRAKRTRYGFVWQGARYEGLITVFLEHLSAFGGQLIDGQGRVRVDEPPALRALGFMRDSVRSGLVPEAALAWQEEPVRFAFQNGDAAFMRNWPYAYPLLADPARSRVAGRVGVAPLPPGPGGRPAAALGGARLAVNTRSEHPAAAVALVRFLTAPEQLLERARVAGQYPPGARSTTIPAWPGRSPRRWPTCGRSSRARSGGRRPPFTPRPLRRCRWSCTRPSPLRRSRPPPWPARPRGCSGSSPRPRRPRRWRAGPCGCGGGR